MLKRYVSRRLEQAEHWVNIRNRKRAAFDHPIERVDDFTIRLEAVRRGGVGILEHKIADGFQGVAEL